MAVLQASFDVNKGGVCHMQGQAFVPVAAITNRNSDYIIASNFVSRSEGKRWALSKYRSSLTRFWDASTSFITLEADMPDMFVPVPRLPSYDGSTRIEKYKEIIIYAGYLDQARPVTLQDIQDNRLLRRFVGIIDTLSFIGSQTTAGVLQIQCRDRMRYFMDTMATYDTGNRQRVEALVSDATGGGSDKIARSKIISEIFNRAVGNIESVDANGAFVCSPPTVCGRKVNEGLIFDLQETQASNQPRIFYESDELEIPLGPSLVNPSAPPEADPKLNIYTSRLGITNAISAMSFSVPDSVPIEFIKWLATQEVNITQVFQDSRTGEIFYSPRVNAKQALVSNDPDFFGRRYFYYDAPLGTSGGIHPHQLLLNFKEETTLLDWRSNIIVSNSGSNTNNNLRVSLSVRPDWLEGQDFGCTFFHVTDSTIETPAEAALVALRYAQEVAKDTKVCSFKVIGDPTLVPDESIQVYGSPFMSDQARENPQSDVQRFDQLDDALIQSIQNNEDALLAEDGSTNSSIPKTLTTVGTDTSNLSEPEVVDVVTEKANGDITVAQCSTDNRFKYDSQKITTIWRVEAVVDKFNDGEMGFFQEVMCLTPM